MAKVELIAKTEMDAEIFTWPMSNDLVTMLAQADAFHVYRDVETNGPRRLAIDRNGRNISLIEGEYLVLDGTGLFTVETAESYAAAFKKKA